MSDQKVKTSTMLWSQQVGMADALGGGNPHDPGYEWSNGRKFNDGKGLYEGQKHHGPPVVPVAVAIATRQAQAVAAALAAITTGSTTAQGQGAAAAVNVSAADDTIITGQSQTNSSAGEVTGTGTNLPGGTAVAIGSQIAPLTVVNTTSSTATNQPFSIGHVFAEGHLPASGAAISLHLPDGTAIPSQLDVKALHVDGSVRHAHVAGIVPSIAAGASLSLSMKRAAAPYAGTPVALPTSLPSATANISGNPYSAQAASNQQYMAWLAGPVVSDYVFMVPFVDRNGVPHATLKAQYSLRVFATGHVRIDYNIEHCQAYTSTADITYDAALLGDGGATLYSKAALVHTPTGRWKRTFWQGAGKSALFVQHDRAYLLDSRQVPNYDRAIVMAETYLNGLTTDLNSGKFDPMGFGRFRPYMPDYGGRPDIGLMPDSHAALVCSQDKRAWDVVMAAGDIGGSYPMCRRDDGTGPGAGYPLSVINWPYASILGGLGDCNNPVTGKNEHLPSLSTASKGVPDSSHQPDIYYLPYLLTCDYFYLEGLHFCGTFNHYQDNPEYRGYAKAWVKSDQLRGQGWSLRTMSECAAITPEGHYLKSHFTQWYNNNIAWYVANYLDTPNPNYVNTLGIIVNGYSISYDVNGGTSNGIAPWMDDFFTQGLGHSYELLKHPDALRLLQFKAQFQVGRMNDPAVCSFNACIYSLGVRTGSGTPNPPFFATLAECFNYTVPASEAQYACATTQRLALHTNCHAIGDIDGYPDSESGYPSNYQPALSFCVNIGYPGADTAWAKFINRPTKPNYGLYGPQFAVVPR